MLKRYIVLSIICAGLLSALGKASAQDQYHAGELIVKFRPDSPEYRRWLENGRSGEIPVLAQIVGPHASGGWIADAGLRAVRNRSKRKSSLLHVGGSIADNLQRIAVIQYPAPLDPVYAVAKLQGHPDLEYAEIMPRHSIAAIPNDPLIDKQYHLAHARVFEAWDVLQPQKDVLIAIIDTGIDYEHEDLAEAIYFNPGESGQDDLGRDKRTNNVDDDGNGFVDDWRGWDFVNGLADGDNDPRPGNGHGTHVAGIAGALANNRIGVAGAALGARLLPVKVGPDNVNSLAVSRGYEGIMYAAAMGADIINCSWGGATNSRAEQEIVNSVVEMGSLIVAASGNNGANRSFYPASYNHVISVAAISEDDRRSAFSNYHLTVDLVAPGNSIHSTFPGNNYRGQSGTSMAAPLVAGVAALLKMQRPAMGPIQIGEQLKATTDNIDRENPGFDNLLGSGKLNALRALTETGAKSMLLESYAVLDSNNNGVLEPGELVEIRFTAHNVLAPVSDVSAKFESLSGLLLPAFSPPRSELGDMATGERRDMGNEPVSFRVPKNIDTDLLLPIQVAFRDDKGAIGDDKISLILNPTFQTMDGNNIEVTLNSVGNIGFNNYPFNTMGLGFIYKRRANLLFEGALMVASSPENISNTARAQSTNSKDKSFLPRDILTKEADGPIAPLEGHTTFEDTLALTDAGVRVRQSAFQFDDPGHEDYVLLKYDVTNISPGDFEELYVGLFFDWDIGTSGASNLALFDYDHLFGYVHHAFNSSLPHVGMQLLTEHLPNFYAIDNDGSGIRVYDGFSRFEKWTTLSSGIGRDRSGITDVSTVISAGPISLKQSETVSLTFSIFAGDSFSEMREHAEKARQRAVEKGIGADSLVRFPKEPRLLNVYPNPSNGNRITITYETSSKQNVSIRVADILGKSLATVFDGVARAGHHSKDLDVSDLPPGHYVVQFRTLGVVESIPFAVTR